MAISIFPSTAAEFVSNNFVIDMNDTSNNTADTGGVKQAGPYSISLSSGDSSFDVYLIDEDGNSVGYSNNTSIVASGLFSTVVILGVAQDEVVSFLYQGSVNNADGEGDQPGAGAYLESISPSDLPSIDDTATVTGGNFGADTEITFESGATVLPAKSITVVSGTELLVTRPDGLIEDDAPYTVRAVTTGVPEPTGTNSNILTDAVTAGSDPNWVTTSPLNIANVDVSFSQTLEATDSDGTVVDYSVTAGTITPGLSLNASTGVLSGTPTLSALGQNTFTVTATDDGGNTTDREFTQEVGTPNALGGVITTDGTDYFHTFTSTDDLVVSNEITNAELFILAGGGAGGDITNLSEGGGGGGAGGLLETTVNITSGTYTATIGAGGSSSNGSNSTFSTLGTAIGGGRGGNPIAQSGQNGGSGGGGADSSGGSGTAGQGNDGGNSGDYRVGAGGGGAGSVGDNSVGTSEPGDGGVGLQRTIIATQSGVNIDSGYFAGGGGGGSTTSNSSVGGLGGGANGGQSEAGDNAIANTGGGGGGGARNNSGGTGGSGLIVVRYPV